LVKVIGNDSLDDTEKMRQIESLLQAAAGQLPQSPILETEGSEAKKGDIMCTPGASEKSTRSYAAE